MTEADQRVRVLVVDDHALFRGGLQELLEEEGLEVATSPGPEDALERLDRLAPDVVLMDLNMPAIDGIEATRRILGRRPGTPVLMLTVNADFARVLEAIHAGALGYLLKDAAIQDIARAVRQAAGGIGAVSPELTSGLLEHVRRTQVGAGRGERPQLTERERSVLALLAQGLDNAEIARRLNVSPSTTKGYVSAVLQKVGAQNRVQAAVLAVRLGLV